MLSVEMNRLWIKFTLLYFMIPFHYFSANSIDILFHHAAQYHQSRCLQRGSAKGGNLNLDGTTWFLPRGCPMGNLDISGVVKACMDNYQRSYKQKEMFKKFSAVYFNDQVTVDPRAIANGFNNFFVNIGPTLASKITTGGISHRNFLKENLQSSFFLEPTNINEIKEVISKLKNGAPGRDEILPKHLKCISESIAHPLSKIANFSFEQGVFPDDLKTAVVSPVYKAKDPMYFNKYCPISLLSVFSKILERLMYNRLLKFIDKNNLLNEFQFGFRNNHSTFMALIVLMENLVTALDSGNCAIGLFLDFQKAFDTVDNCILLDKLLSYGVFGIAHVWFNSYLSNRLQSVNYNGQESDFKLMKCGVPQDSILGPLLFLIYDLPNVSNFLCQFFLQMTQISSVQDPIFLIWFARLIKK